MPMTRVLGHGRADLGRAARTAQGDLVGPAGAPAGARSVDRLAVGGDGPPDVVARVAVGDLGGRVDVARGVDHAYDPADGRGRAADDGEGPDRGVVAGQGQEMAVGREGQGPVRRRRAAIRQDLVGPRDDRGQGDLLDELAGRGELGQVRLRRRAGQRRRAGPDLDDDEVAQRERARDRRPSQGEGRDQEESHGPEFPHSSTNHGRELNRVGSNCTDPRGDRSNDCLMKPKEAATATNGRRC